MNNHRSIIIKYRLEKARETLDAAEVLLRENKLFSAVNRIYYSLFYAVDALLLSKGLSSPKHSGVLALFNKEFVNKGIIDKDSGRFYAKMFDRRQKGDYKDLVEFDKEDVGNWLVQAKNFVDVINNYLSKQS